MRTSFRVALAWAAVWVAVVLVGLAPAVAAEPEDGWVELFNGKNLDGWRFHLR